MKIGNIKKKAAESVNPFFSGMTLTGRAVTITARIIMNDFMTAVFTNVGIISKGISFTGSHIVESLEFFIVETAARKKVIFFVLHNKLNVSYHERHHLSKGYRYKRYDYSSCFLKNADNEK